MVALCVVFVAIWYLVPFKRLGRRLKVSRGPSLRGNAGLVALNVCAKSRGRSTGPPTCSSAPCVASQQCVVQLHPIAAGQEHNCLALLGLGQGLQAGRQEGKGCRRQPGAAGRQASRQRLHIGCQATATGSHVLRILWMGFGLIRPCAFYRTAQGPKPTYMHNSHLLLGKCMPKHGSRKVR